MQMLLQELSAGARRLLRDPGPPALILTILALGLAVNGAVFGILQAVVLRPLPYPDAERLVSIASTTPRDGGSPTLAAPRDFVDWRKEAKGFDAMAAYMMYSAVLTGSGDARNLITAAVTPDFFEVLRPSFALGRTFRPEEGELGRNVVAILSHSLWQGSFGGGESILGRRLILDGESYTVIGVLGPQHEIPSRRVELFLPLALDEDRIGRRRPLLSVLARRSAGVGPEGAQSSMDAVTRSLEELYPETNRGRRALVRPLKESSIGEARPLLVALQAAGLVLLVLICTNISNLVLVRAAERREELQLRRAFGAGWGRLVALHASEVLLLAVAGTVVAVPLAHGLLRLLVATSPAQLDRLESARIDLVGLAFVGALALVAMGAAGLPTVWRVLSERRGEDSRALAGSRSVTRQRGLAGRGMVVLMTGLALCLLANAGLMLQTLQRLGQVDLGFDPRRLLILHIELADARYSAPRQQVDFFDTFLSHLKELPGVSRVAAVAGLPFQRSAADFDLGVEREGSGGSGAPAPRQASARIASPGYFRTLGIPLVMGRDFREGDDKDSPPVAVVNETLARQLFSGEDPLGKRFHVFFRDGIDCEVVGVVGDTRYDGIDRPVKAEFFLPLRQLPLRGLSVVVKGGGPTDGLVKPALAELQRLDPDQPVFGMATMEERIALMTAPQRFLAHLLTVAGLAALVLAALGVYGLLSREVTRRLKEIGVRRVFGASEGSIRWMILSELGILVAAGLGLGCGLFFATSHWLRSVVFGVEVSDPATLFLSALVLLLASGAGSLLPLVRATSAEPAGLLRSV